MSGTPEQCKRYRCRYPDKVRAYQMAYRDAERKRKREKLVGEIHEIIRMCVAMAGGVATLDFMQEVHRIIDLRSKHDH